MKYKITPDSNKELFDKISEIFDTGIKYRRLALDWAARYGSEEVAEPHSSFIGGADGIVLNKKPNGWTTVCDKICRPRAGSREFKEMEALPFVGRAIINELFDYCPRSVPTSDGKFKIMFAPGISICDDFVLVNFSEYVTYYKPIDGMIEILESEYIKLSEKISEDQ